jgi:hypothetical protein
VHASPQSRGQTHIAGHHERKISGAAQPGYGTPQSSALPIAVVPQHHARKPARQLCDSGQRIRQTLFVREQPEDRQAS